MKDYLILCMSHRGVDPKCLASIKDCESLYVEVCGFADVGLGRNKSLMQALSIAEKEKLSSVVLVDDDMTFGPDTVDSLSRHCQELQAPVSAIYTLKDGTAAAHCYKRVPVVGEPWMSNRWMCGLGLIAIPTTLLRSLADSSDTVDVLGPTTIFTWAGPDAQGSEWYGEDTRLCKRLGGAILAPLPAGHLKQYALMPDADSIERIQKGELFKDPEA
jgi:hypothetical protein